MPVDRCVIVAASNARANRAGEPLALQYSIIRVGPVLMTDVEQPQTCA